MNTLYFVKFQNRYPRFDNVVFILTATDEADAEAQGRDMINPKCVDEYDTKTVEAICQTPDTIERYEPC